MRCVPFLLLAVVYTPNAGANCERLWPPGSIDPPRLPPFSGRCDAAYLGCFQIEPTDVSPGFVSCIGDAITAAATADELLVYAGVFTKLPPDSPGLSTLRARLEARLHPENPWQLELLATYTGWLRTRGLVTACEAAARADRIATAQRLYLASNPAGAPLLLNLRTVVMHDCAALECDPKDACMVEYARFACEEQAWARSVGFPEPYPELECRE